MHEVLPETTIDSQSAEAYAALWWNIVTQTWIDGTDLTYIRPGGKIEGTGLKIDGQTYSHSWLWDTTIFALGIIAYLEHSPHRAEDIKLVKALLLPLTYYLTSEDLFPHMRYWGGRSFEAMAFGDAQKGKWVSTITQPPNVVYAAMELSRVTGEYDIPFLTQIFHAGASNICALLNTRRLPGNGTSPIYTISPLETGRDHSSSFDTIFHIHPRDSYFAHTIKQIPHRIHIARNNGDITKLSSAVAAVDFNCFVLEEMLALAELSMFLGKEEFCAQLLAEAQNIMDIMRMYMWNAERYGFVDLDRNWNPLPGTPFSTLFPISIDPTRKGIFPHMRFLTQQQIDILFSRLETDEFRSPWGMLSESRYSALFDPDAYWRGDVWNIISYFYEKAAFIHGRNDLVEQLTHEAIAWGKPWPERKNAQTGKPRGAVDFGWAKAVTLILGSMYKQVHNKS